MATAVMGAQGGLGATRLAIALARAAGAVLLDLDDLAGGVDVWCGDEGLAGVRWSGLTLAGGALEPRQLIAALPRADGVPVLAADRIHLPSTDAVVQVLDLLHQHPVVVDLPRRLDDRAVAVLERCDSVVLLTAATIAGSVAAHTVAAALESIVPVGLAVVGSTEPPATIGWATGRPVLAAARDLDALVRLADALAVGLSDDEAESA